MAQLTDSPDDRKQPKDELLLRRLHMECMAALERYVVEADKLCQMLGAYNSRTIGVVEQVDLVAQRELENEAHVEYVRARKQLLRRAHVRSTLKPSYFSRTSSGVLA